MSSRRRSTSPDPRDRRRSRLAIATTLVVAAVAVYFWRQRTTTPRAAVAWPLPDGVTLDDAATTWRLLHTDDDPREPIPEPDAERLAFLTRRSRRDDAVFVATGNTYHHGAYEEKRPIDEAGDELRTWFMDYLRFERAKLDTDFPVGAGLSKPAAIDLRDRPAARRALDQATRAAADAIVRAHPANGDPKTAVWLLDGGRSELDARRDASLAQVVGSRARTVEIVHVPYRPGDPSLPPLGVRVGAEAVVGGKLVKDVVSDDQWTELLDGRAAVAKLAAPPAGHRLVDAHVHLADDDDDNLVAVLTSGGVGRAVVAPLPRGLDYGELEAANARVLRAATRFPDRIFPLVMVSPLAEDPAADLEKWVSRGARGLKLMSGHDAYFKAANGLQLDDEKMRRVLEVCDRRDLPVLWHVNSHVYGEGFLRILRDYRRVRIVNPHFGGYLTYAPAAMRTLLDAHPNLYFDVSLGARAVYVRRSLEDLAYLAPAWRQLFVDYPTRFLWGTDLVITKETARSHTNATYRLYRDTYERDRYDLDYVPLRGFSLPWEDGHHRQGLTGIALPQDVLKRLYAENAESVYFRSAP